MKEKFRKVASRVSTFAGSAWVFCLAVLLVGIWGASGPTFRFSDTWQLVINTGTTIVTFLMVFLIQNTQNRDAKAIQIKLDELLRATRARDTFIDIEDLSDEELAQLAAEFRKIQKADDDNPAFMKFRAKMEGVLTKRRNLPGQQVATHVVNLLNPFAARASQDKNKKK